VVVKSSRRELGAATRREAARAVADVVKSLTKTLPPAGEAGRRIRGQIMARKKAGAAVEEAPAVEENLDALGEFDLPNDPRRSGPTPTSARTGRGKGTGLRSPGPTSPSGRTGSWASCGCPSESSTGRRAR
jgi:hypothetical protein